MTAIFGLDHYICTKTGEGKSDLNRALQLQVAGFNLRLAFHPSGVCSLSISVLFHEKLKAHICYSTQETSYELSSIGHLACNDLATANCFFLADWEKAPTFLLAANLVLDLVLRFVKHLN